MKIVALFLKSVVSTVLVESDVVQLPRLLTMKRRHPIQKHHEKCRRALPGGAVDQHHLEDEEGVPMGKVVEQDGEVEGVPVGEVVVDTLLIKGMFYPFWLCMGEEG